MKQQREHWGSKFGFILAAAGSAIGLGSIWRFPYVVGSNGGGAFVVLYLIFTFVICVPIFVGELIIGRRSQKSAVLAYTDLAKSEKNWKGIGYLNFVTCFIILSYYCVISGWCLNYALMSLNQFSTGKSPQEIRDIFHLVFSSADINIFWLLIFILMNVGVLYSGIRKGIERWSKLLMPALFVIMIALFFYSMTFSGFGEAVRFCLVPDFSTINTSSVLQALGMALFTLSAGLGIILTYGSYLKKDVDLPKTSLIVAGMTLLISFVSVFIIFPIVFSFGLEPEGGPGLVFQTIPILFSQLPGNLVLSSVFFLLLVFAAFTSTISLFEVLVANLIDLLNWTRAKAVITCTVGVFIFGIPSALAGSKLLFPNWAAIYGRNFFDTMDYLTASWMMPAAALLTTLFIGWFVDKRLVQDEFSAGSKFSKVFKPWLFTMRWVVPFVILIIILEEAGIINLTQLF